MLVIRPAEVQDADGIAHVHVTAWQETYRGLMPDSVLDTLSIQRRAEQWKNSLADPTDLYHATIVAEVSERIIGFINYGREREGDVDYRGEIFALYVLKDFHGRGLGRRLMQEAVTGLLAQKLASMLVWVLAENPTRHFYEHLGGVYLREKSIQIGGSSLPEVAYGWRDIGSVASK